MARALGTPAGSLSTSKLIASDGAASAAARPNPAVLGPVAVTVDAPATPVPPATSRPLMAASPPGNVCGRLRQRPHSLVVVGAIAYKPAGVRGGTRWGRPPRS